MEPAPENTRSIEEMIASARQAQAVFESYDQAQVDAVVKAIGKVIYDNAETLAIEAVEESRLGNVPSKIAKQQGCAMAHWAYLKDKKSVGVIEEDPVSRVVTIAKPIGVIGCITPSTNPTTTLVGNAMSALKCRNAIIAAPHPRAKIATFHGAGLMRRELKKLGAPEDLVQCIQRPNIESTQRLISLTDAVIATGGPAMVKAAYSCGKPSFGVGQGNVQVLIDRGCLPEADYIAQGTIANRNRDYGIPCVGEQCLIMPAEEEEQYLAAFIQEGAYILEQPEDVEKLRRLLFKEADNGGHLLNVDAVGKPAPELAAAIGLRVPPDTKILLAKASGPADQDLLCLEKLAPVSAWLTYESFEEGLALALQNLKAEGSGHSSCVYSHNDEHICLAGESLPVARLLVNCSSSMAGGASFSIGLNPTPSLGCGTWGNNSVSENLTYRHLMNLTKVATVIQDAYIPTPDEIWGK